MNKQQEALKLALEALEETLRTLDDENAKPGGAISDTIWYSEHETLFDYLTTQITAIREALADSALDRMADNARELGLDYAPIVEQVEDFVGMGHKAWDMVDPKELAKGFHEALAEPAVPFGDMFPGWDWDKTPQAFQDWWNADYDPTGNPFRQNSHAYWAWAGWKAATEQPAQQQEPVARVINKSIVWRPCDIAGLPTGSPLHTSPPASKPWVGLTAEDKVNIEKIVGITEDDDGWMVSQMFTLTEAKLREKNA